jgi:hypothetical protein
LRGALWKGRRSKPRKLSGVRVRLPPLVQMTDARKLKGRVRTVMTGRIG